MKVIDKYLLILLLGFSGMVHAMGTVTLRNSQQSLEHSLELLESERCLLEGKMYLYGEDTIEPDYKRAFGCFEKAVDQDASLVLKNESAYFLGLMCDKGLGIKKDSQKARLLNKIYKQGINQAIDAQVYYELGVICYGDKDYAKARDYYKKAAEQNVNQAIQAMAWCNLGALLDNGQGGDQDYEKGREYYEKAATQNASPGAQAMAWKNLGQVYDNGEGVDKNYEKAREYYEKAAGQDVSKSAQAMAWECLGFLYANAHGVVEDYEKARKYYEKAAKQNVNREVKESALLLLQNLSDG